TIKDDRNIISNHTQMNLPLPIENEESRPRLDLIVFIINLTSELSLQSAEASLKYLDPGYFLEKSASCAPRRCSKLAASLQSPLLFAEDQVCANLLDNIIVVVDFYFSQMHYYVRPTQTFSFLKSPHGVANATERLLTILKVSAGLVPWRRLCTCPT
uniref:Centromere protein M n=1 Tax=Neogobius melanostomus TaxID=47308 RepID=A0A8C6SA41_9GOBI